MFVYFYYFLLRSVSYFITDAFQDQIDSKRRELHRLNDEINAVTATLTAATEDEKEYLKRQRKILLDDMQDVSIELSNLTGQQNVKRHRSSFTTTVPIQDVSERVLWDADVVQQRIPREIVTVDELLQPARALISELRWLQLKLLCLSPANSNRCSLRAIQAMRQQRDPNQRDLELPYHPLLLLFYQAAATGQAELEFLSEDHQLPKPREDIRGMLHGVRQVPQECKAEYVYNPTSIPNSSDAMDANAEPLGKLLQVSYTRTFDITFEK